MLNQMVMVPEHELDEQEKSFELNEEIKSFDLGEEHKGLVVVELDEEDKGLELDEEVKKIQKYKKFVEKASSKHLEGFSQIPQSDF